jgi:PAS domain S-box-containing protein
MSDTREVVIRVAAADYEKFVESVKHLNFSLRFVRGSRLDKTRSLSEAEAEVRLVRSVVDQGFSAVLIVRADLPEPMVVYINPAFAQATGLVASQVVGHPLRALTGFPQVHGIILNGVPRDERFVEEVSTYQTAAGERWGEWRIGPVKDKQGQATHWLVIFRDITERKRLEREILEISDRERQRIGQDLHDGLCQQLAGIELMSQVLEQKLGSRSRGAAGRAGEISQHVRNAIAQTRSLARGLSPVTLDSEGLVSALQELAANTERIFGVFCRFEHGDPVRVADLATATHLYRIAQEAVSNATKHGKATVITIQLRQLGDQLVLEISDNGAGLPATGGAGRGMGLRIMRYRAGIIGGSVTVGNHGNRPGAFVICSVACRPSTGTT